MYDADTTKSMARSQGYRFLALGFGYPDTSVLNLLRQELDPLEASLGVLEDTRSLEIAKPMRTMLKTLTRADLQTCYLRCFGHAISKDCPPYEAEYGQAHIFQQTQTLADIAGFYRAFGLELAADVHDRLDHIGVQLEFMQFLCLKEAHGLHTHRQKEQLNLCRDAQCKFLCEHLGRWVFGFARRLEDRAEETLYRLFGQLLRSFLARELSGFGLTPAEVGGSDVVAQPEPVEGADCQSCMAPIPAFPSNKKVDSHE